MANPRTTCENCGSRVYSRGCVNCDEENYIAEQSEYDALDEADRNSKPQWWGYRHTSGSVQAKRFWGDCASIEDAYDSDFVADVVEPFEADSRNEALRIVAERSTR